MRVTAVPAQVTTVEDRIAGRLGMSQMVLLFIPIIFGSLLYAGLPPAMHSAPYKLVVLTLLLCTCGILAIRIKGKIVLFWIAVLLRYWLRPRYYVFDKRSVHGRNQYHGAVEVDETEEKEEKPERSRLISPLTLDDLIRVKDVIENPEANLGFEVRKGGLYVRITEVKQEG